MLLFFAYLDIRDERIRKEEMSNYKYLLWDLDGTIFDFIAAEKAAIQTLFQKYEFGTCSDEMIDAYSKINKRYWEALERNEMTKQEILVRRFEDFFKIYELPVSLAADFNKDYQLALGDTIAYHDDAKTILEQLKQEGYILVAITNGTKQAQDKKLHLSGLDLLFDAIFISEEVGVEKPNIEYFEIVFSKLQLKNKKEVLVIGDSLTSDIKGANHAQVDCCWYNPNKQKNEKDVTITYEISDLHEIKNLV